MIILYYMGAELITVTLGTMLSIKAVSNSVINVYDNGYKYDKEKQDKEICERKDIENNKIKVMVRNISLFIPGVNLIRPIMSLYKANNAYKDEEINKVISPMTGYEKEVYSKIDKTREKVAFSVALTAIGEYRESDEKRVLRKQKEENEIEKLRRLGQELSMQINNCQIMNNELEEMYDFAGKQKILRK